MLNSKETRLMVTSLSTSEATIVIDTYKDIAFCLKINMVYQEKHQMSFTNPHSFACVV